MVPVDLFQSRQCARPEKMPIVFILLSSVSPLLYDCEVITLFLASIGVLLSFWREEYKCLEKQARGVGIEVSREIGASRRQSNESCGFSSRNYPRVVMSAFAVRIANDKMVVRVEKGCASRRVLFNGGGGVLVGGWGGEIIFINTERKKRS